MGRFLAPDAVRAVDAQSGQINAALLANPQRHNVYAYSLNNPYRYVDPDGEHPLLIALIGAVVYGNLATPGVANAPDVGGEIYQGPSALEVTGNTLEGAAIGLSLTRLAGEGAFASKAGTRVDDLIRSSKLGRATKGRSTLFERKGGLTQANKDFDALNQKMLKIYQAGEWVN